MMSRQRHRTQPRLQDLEARTLLSVYALDDWAYTRHDRSLSYSSVLNNDNSTGYPTPPPLSASLESGPSHGAVTLNGDGSFVYVPATHFTGQDSFVYRASAGGSSALATVHIDVTNAAPVFAPIGVSSAGVEEIPADATVTFHTGDVIGSLVAYDQDNDSLTYSSLTSSPFLQILGDGRVQIIDGPGLAAYFIDGAGADIVLSVSVTDGLASAVSQFTLLTFSLSSSGWRYYPNRLFVAGRVIFTGT